MYCGTHLSPANTASLIGREWDILSQKESNSDLNVALEWDVIPDTPYWMRENHDIIGSNSFGANKLTKPSS